MKRLGTLALGCLSLLGVLPAQAAWYTEPGGHEWQYRLPIVLDGASGIGSTIVVDLDADAALAALGQAGSLDGSSVRVVRSGGSLAAQQEFNDTVYQGFRDASGNGQGEVRFLLEDAPGAGTYYLYFDTVANGPKPASPANVINGTFEQSAGSVPTNWVRSSIRANGRQDNAVVQSALGNAYAVAAGCQTAGAIVDNSPNNNGVRSTGLAWHLLGYRDRCEDGSGNELVRLARTLRVPAGAAAGTLDFSFQIQAWDGIDNSTDYDWFVFRINGAAVDHRTLGVVPGAPTLVITATRIGRDAYGNDLRDHGWRDARLDLSPWAGQNISFMVEARFSATDNDYRSWIKLDDVQWSRFDAKLDAPEQNSAAAARLMIRHDGSGIYCLAEPVRVAVLDVSGNPIADYAGEIRLDTQSGAGSWSLGGGSGTFSNLGGGAASYVFDPADDGAAWFLLSYTAGADLLDVDAYVAADPGIRDDDSEGRLQFAPSGFTLTASPLANPPPVPINDPVGNQIAGAGFPLYITAYGTTPEHPECGVIETYAGPRLLEFWMDYVDPGTGTRLLTIDGAAVGVGSGAAAQLPVSFAGGQARVLAKYKDAGSIDLQLRDRASFGHVLNGGVGPFVVKPAALQFFRIADAAGSLNPGTGVPAGTAFVAAGEAFVVDVDVLDAEGDRLPNFGREATPESLTAGSLGLVFPLGGRHGSTGDVLAGTAFAPSGTAGRWRNSAVNFDEVGAIRLQAYLRDGDYLGAGDIPVAGPVVVGRFHPARFDLASDLLAPACSGFSYMDQAGIRLEYDLVAEALGGGVTENYDAALLGAANVATAALVAEDSDAGVDLGARLTTAAAAWNSGHFRVVDPAARFARAAAPDGPFDSLRIGLSLADPLADAELAGRNLNADTSGDCVAAGDCSARTLGGIQRVRYGRLALLPAQGPENLDLDAGLMAQYFNGAAFVRHTLDQCTTYAMAAATLSDFQGNLTAALTGVLGPAVAATLVAGMDDPAAPLLIAAPGVGNEGSALLTVDVPAFLEFNWGGAGAVDPGARVTFGRYRGHDRIIYWSEEAN